MHLRRCYAVDRGWPRSLDILRSRCDDGKTQIRQSQGVTIRYLLSWHIRESELHERRPEWKEEVLSFLSVFENELLMSSELELVETLSPESQAIVVGPGTETRDGIYNVEGKPSARLWLIRVENKDRAIEIAARIAGELDTWIEVRECFSGAQRP